MKNIPLVSVCCITYNHEKFIEETLKGFLSQKTSFLVEFIIGNDNSTDRTAEIIDKYAKIDPRIIHINRQKNLGMSRNALNVISQAKGKYLAFCEGDDYWSYKYKLQHQVNFMEKHSDCSIHFHNVSTYDQEKKIFLKKKSKLKNGLVFHYQDLLNKNILTTLSCMYRNINITRWPKWLYISFPLDWPLHIIYSLHGYIYYSNKNMAVYRKHKQSITHRTNYEYQGLEMIKMLNNIQISYMKRDDFKYARNGIGKIQSDLARYYAVNKHGEKSTIMLFQSLKNSGISNNFTVKLNCAVLLFKLMVGL